MRKCRDCSKVLTADRYFKCKKCQPQLPSMADDDLVYESFGIDSDLEKLAELFGEGEVAGSEDLISKKIRR